MTTSTAPDSTATAESLAERLFNDAITTMEGFSVALGVQLGLYRAFEQGPLDPRQLAERAGIHPRYAREWLEQQAVAGIVHTGEWEGDPYARPFSLPTGHREVLLNQDSPSYLGTLPGLIASFAGLLPQLEDAYRSGGGVHYHAYGPLTRHGIGGMNRPMFVGQLDQWLAALPDIQQRLLERPGRVLDLGCGTGWSTLTLAKLFPLARVHGVDLDQASVEEARRAASQAGVDDRVSFGHGDAATVIAPGRSVPIDGHETGSQTAQTDGYDLVCVLEALHDIADPVAVLRAAREQLAPGGAVLIGDEAVGERFAAEPEPVERLNYGFSVLHCLPATRAEGTAVEAGAVLRPGTVREYAGKAGLDCTILPVEHDLWRFYRLDPA